MYTPSVVAFSGSARSGSYNSLLVRIAADAARADGARVTLVDWREFPLPLMDEDLEKASGMPKPARAFKELLFAHDGFLISAPEYNSSITPLLKNAIDWASRREGDEKPLQAFAGKPVALMSASPGALGGLRGLVHVRAILGNIRMLVLPDQVAVSKASDAFGPDGNLKDPQQQASIQALGTGLNSVLRKLRA